VAVEPIVGPLLALIGAVAAAYLTYRVSSRKLKTDAGQQMIDQHQEDIAALRTETAAQWGRINQLERVARVQGDYIGELRRHIADGRPPPPPPYPSGLIT
jgi:membrane protein implicated in regulation of membrane protease activity